MLAEGWATPLSGFMRERQYLQCLHFGQILDLKEKCNEPGEQAPETRKEEQILETEINQSIAIVLPINEADKQRLKGYRGILIASITVSNL